MDPEEVKLTLLQKIKPFFKAFDREVPWQILLLIAFTFTMSLNVYAPFTILGPKVLWYVVNGACLIFVNIVIFIATGFSLMAVTEISGAVLNGFKTIRYNYKEEALEEKKKVLEEVIEKQILK